MLLLIVIIAIAIVCTKISSVWRESVDMTKYSISVLTMAVAACLYGVACIMLTFAIIINLVSDGLIASNQQRYESLVYQYENDIYDNDNDLGKNELYSEITEWNEDLAKNKAMRNSIWVGILYANIYDQFDFIEFEG